MSIRIYSHSNKSQGIRELARNLNVKILKKHNSRYRSKKYDVIINWGVKKVPENLEDVIWLNDPRLLPKDKLDFYRDYKEFVPPFTKDLEAAEKWQRKGRIVLARQTLTGSCGEGIVVCPPGIPLPDAEVYTKYIPKSEEWRVHFLRGEILCYQQKLYTGKEEGDFLIRSFDRGFTYNIREVEYVTSTVVEIAKRFVLHTDIDFGAMDIIYQTKLDRAWILEVNTAPGLSETTLIHYTDGFLGYLQSCE